jgi:hypothetical protein
MAFPVSRKQLNDLENEENVPKDVENKIVIHRIATEVFNLAAEGRHRYACIIKTRDAIKFVELLFEMFPDSKIEIQRSDMFPDETTLAINWL